MKIPPLVISAPKYSVFATIEEIPFQKSNSCHSIFKPERILDAACYLI